MNYNVILTALYANNLINRQSEERKIQEIERKLETTPTSYSSPAEPVQSRGFKRIETEVDVYDTVIFTYPDNSTTYDKLTQSNIKTFKDCTVLKFNKEFSFELSKAQVLDAVNNHLPIEFSKDELSMLSKITDIEFTAVAKFHIISNDSMSYSNEDGSFGRNALLMSDMETSSTSISRLHSSCETDDELRELESLFEDKAVLDAFLRYYVSHIKFDVKTRKETHILEIPL